MPRFRKKPVIIEAMQFTDESKDQCFNFVTCTRKATTDGVTGRPFLVIQTLEGDMIAELGDWIIRGVAGEFYPRTDTFEQTYEPVEENCDE